MEKGVNSGTSHWNAETMDALLAGGPLQACVCGVWAPVRPEETPQTLAKGMEQFHHSVLEQTGDRVTGLRCFILSGYGAGRVIKYDAGDVPEAERPAQPCAEVVDLSENQTGLTKRIKAASLSESAAQKLYEYERVQRPGAHGKHRPKIEALLLNLAGPQQERTEDRLDKEREEREVQIAARSADRLAWAGGTPPEAPQYTLRLGQASADEVESGVAYDSSDVERKLKKKQKKAAVMVDKVEQRRLDSLEARREVGLFPCDGRDPVTKLPCCRQYNTATGLSKHQRAVADGRSRHTGVGGTNVRDQIVRMAAMQGGSLLCVGARPDRSSAAPVVVVVEGVAGTARDRAGCGGTFIRPPAAKPYMKKEAQLAELRRMFYIGHSAEARHRGEKRMTPEAIYSDMSTKTDDEGRLFFSRRPGNAHGKLLPVDTIRAWVAATAAELKKTNRQRPEAAAAPATAAAASVAGGCDGESAAQPAVDTIDTIQDRRTTPQGEEQYLVRWVGLPVEKETWLSEGELMSSCPEKVAAWNQQAGM